MTEEDKELIEWLPPEKPWYQIGRASGAQTEVIREFAREMGYKDLRGFWKMMSSMNWDYYDVIKLSCRE